MTLYKFLTYRKIQESISLINKNNNYKINTEDYEKTIRYLKNEKQTYRVLGNLPNDHEMPQRKMRGTITKQNSQTVKEQSLAPRYSQ